MSSDCSSAERRRASADLETYASFAEQVRRTKRKLLSFLIAAKDEGKRICGYGAPGKGNTLLNYCGIGTDFLDFTVDRNPYKHGRFTPGMHIPILPGRGDRRGQARLPADPAVEPQGRDRRSRCATSAIGAAKFIVPIPEVTIIDPTELWHEGRAVLRRSRHAHPRLFGEHPEADDPGRPPADPVARDAVLQPVRAPRFRAVPRLQGQHHQGVLPQLPPQSYCRLRDLGARHEGRAAGRGRGGLARHAGRHRHLAQHRPAAAGRCAITSRTRRCSSPTTATACRDVHARRDDRAASRRAARSAASSPCGRRSPSISPSSTRGGRARFARPSRLRHLDQRRLLRLSGARSSTTSRKARSWCSSRSQR